MGWGVGAGQQDNIFPMGDLLETKPPGSRDRWDFVSPGVHGPGLTQGGAAASQAQRKLGQKRLQIETANYSLK